MELHHHTQPRDLTRGGPLVTAERFQIINGAQTVGAIAGAPNAPELTVLFRLTETKEASGGRFTESIVRYNNTQNPVEVADFRANDPIQQFLVGALGKISGKGAVPRFVYVPKRGGRRGGRGGRTLTSKELAGLRHSFLYNPIASYREPKSLFDPSDKGLYWQAFGSDDGRVSYSWTEGEIAHVGLALALDERIKALAKKLKGLDDPPQHARYLHRFSRYIVALVFEGLRAVHADMDGACVAAVKSKKDFETLVETALKCSIRAVAAEMARRQAENSEVQPEYNFVRDVSAWTQLRLQVVGDIKTEAGFRDLEI